MRNQEKPQLAGCRIGHPIGRIGPRANCDALFFPYGMGSAALYRPDTEAKLIIIAVRVTEFVPTPVSFLPSLTPLMRVQRCSAAPPPACVVCTVPYWGTCDAWHIVYIYIHTRAAAPPGLYMHRTSCTSYNSTYILVVSSVMRVPVVECVLCTTCHT